MCLGPKVILSNGVEENTKEEKERETHLWSQWVALKRGAWWLRYRNPPRRSGMTLHFDLRPAAGCFPVTLVAYAVPAETEAHVRSLSSGAAATLTTVITRYPFEGQGLKRLPSDQCRSSLGTRSKCPSRTLARFPKPIGMCPLGRLCHVPNGSALTGPTLFLRVVRMEAAYAARADQE